MSDADLKKEALEHLDAASDSHENELNRFRETTVGYTRVKKPVPPTSKWGQGFSEAGKVDAHIEAARLAVEQMGTATNGNGNGGSDDFIGICCYRESDFTKIAQLGVKSIRFDRPDAEVISDVRAAGLEVLVGVWFNPWSDLNGGRDDRYPPLPQHRAEWAKRMVNAWRNMGKRPLALECWNEPWLPNFWKPGPEPANYLALCKALAQEAWSVWNDIPILVSADTVGGGDTGSFQWRAGVIQADTTGFLADPRVFPTTHNYCEARGPYAVTPKPCWWDFNRYECAYDDFKNHGHPDPKVWVTEYGWRTGNVLKAVTENEQAAFVVDGIKQMQESGKVERSYSFLYKSNDTEWAYNWLRPNNSEKPVCDAVRGLV